MFEQLLPILLALNAALFFATSYQLQNLGLRDLDSRTGIFISLIASASVFWLLSPLFLESWYWFNGAILVFAAIGLIRPFLSANLALTGIRYLGPTLASTLMSTSPFFAAMLGIIWLGEDMTWPVALGTMTIVGGIILLASGGRVRFGWPLWALMLPVGASLIRSLGHAMTKYGMESIPSPLFAALIGTSVSAFVALATQRAKRKEKPAAWRWSSHQWFVYAGIANAVGLLSLNTAISKGEIISVVPVVACSPVITMLQSRFIFKQEAIGARKVMAVCIIVPAIILIASSGT